MWFVNMRVRSWRDGRDGLPIAPFDHVGQKLGIDRLYASHRSLLPSTQRLQKCIVSMIYCYLSL